MRISTSGNSLAAALRPLKAAIIAVTVAAGFAGCSGGGDGGGGGGQGVSSQVVNGVAATGAALSGLVSIKDASSPARETSTVIASDGSFALDVSDMKGPFLLKAVGAMSGTNRAYYSFAESVGTANINPLSSAAVADAAGVDDPADAYDKADAATRDKLKARMPAAVAAIQAQLKPLLDLFSAANADPVKDQFRADHNGLDAVFDNVTIALSGGTLTITNSSNGAVLFTADVKDIEHGHFTDKDEDLPRPGPRATAPTGVTATGGDRQVTIVWNPVSNATSYSIYWSTKSDDVAEDGAKISNVTSPFVHTGLAPNTTYYYVVRAVNARGNSAKSDQVSATTSSSSTTLSVPAAPTGVVATGGTKQTSVSWSSATGAASYNLYWSTTSGVTTANGTKIAGVTSPAVHTGLTDATNYYYIVTAVNSAGESAASQQVAATTLSAPAPGVTVPAAPAGLSATGGTNQNTVSWSAVSGAASYNLYWSTSSGVTTSNGTKISGVTSPYVHTGLTAGQTYYYIVTAVNTAGESAASAPANATTAAPSPSTLAAPTGLNAVGGSKLVTVSWTAVTGATSYNLYWSTSSGVTAATGTKIAGVTSPFVQTSLNDSTAYFYVVTAVNSAGESAASFQATATTSAAAPPPAINGATLYLSANSCVTCHGGSLDPANSSHVLGSDKQGSSAALITSGISGVSAMRTRFNATTGTVFQLTPAQINAIAAALQ